MPTSSRIAPAASTTAPRDRVADPTGPLRRILRANAAASFLGGLLAAAAPERLDSLLGTGHPGWVRLVGIGLVLFADAVLLVSFAREDRLRRFTPEIVIADASWVAASVATIGLGWFSSRGAVAIGLVAAMVGAFAVGQHRANR